MSGQAIGWVFSHSPMRGADLLVHLALGDVANDMHDNELWCSTATIADKTHLARYTVTKALAALVDAGQLVLLEERPGRSNRYRLVLNLPATTDGTLPDSPPSEMAPPATPDGSTRHQEWHELQASQDDNPAPADPIFTDLDDFEYLKHEPNPDALSAVRDRFKQRADLG